MNAIETAPSDHALIDTTDHIRGQWEARSIVEVDRATRRRNRRLLSIAGAGSVVLGPTLLTLALGASAGDAFGILALTIVPVAGACFLLQPR